MVDEPVIPIDHCSRIGPLLRASTLTEALSELLLLVFPSSAAERSVAISFVGSRRLAPEVQAPRAMLWWVLHQVAAVGASVRLRPEVWPSVTQSVQGRIETAFRARAARAFGLPALTHSSRLPPWWQPGLTRQVRVCLRALAAAGPLWIDDLLDAAGQAGGSGRRQRPDYDHLVAALVSAGAHCLPADGRWSYDSAPDEEDRLLVQVSRAAGRRRHTASQVGLLLKSAGISSADRYAAIRRSSVIVRTGRNRYAVLGSE